MIYFYGRVSTDHQENSAANQRQVFEQLAAEMGEPHQILIEEDVSGSTSLKDRPLGRRVWDALKPGDILVVTKLDRGWRSVEDAAHSLRVLRELGVRLKILDCPVDVSTDEGEMMFVMFASFAQYENKVRGRRVRDVFQYRKRNGLPYSITRPYGWRRKGDDWIPLPEERELADQAAEMREAGMSFNAIALKWVCANKKKPVFRPQLHHGRKTTESWYTGRDIKNLLWARAAGFPKVPQAHVRDYVPAGMSV
jgi:DNA invertase Pin-like site-specific DNA recombinase